MPLMNEDQTRNYNKYQRVQLAILRHMALNLMQK